METKTTYSGFITDLKVLEEVKGECLKREITLEKLGINFYRITGKVWNIYMVAIIIDPEIPR